VGAARASGRPEGAAPTKVVDTTGAGDAFVGVLAAALAASSDERPHQTALRDAVEKAVRAASRTVTQRGARIPLNDLGGLSPDEGYGPSDH
jgi:ribokinase